MKETLLKYYLQQANMHEAFIATLLNHAKETNDNTLVMLCRVHMVELSELLNTVPELELPATPERDHTDITNDNLNIVGMGGRLS